MLKAALVGFGGITGSHRAAYAKLEQEGKVKLVAACDINPEAFKKVITINTGETAAPASELLHCYTDIDEMIAKEEFDIADVCVPTFLHRPLSEKMLNAGKHVMSEKPMSLTYADCAEMIKTAKKNGKELMVGQCLRFYPAYDYIKAALDDGRFGRVLGGFFTRLSPPPMWAWENWFMNPERSGGCLTDLHIHDIDIIRYLFGEPEAVSCRATTSESVYDTVHTSLFYGDVPITAIGDWSMRGVKFEAKCRISMEKATLVFEGGALTVYPKDGSASYNVELADISGQHGELSYFCDVIEGRIKNTKNTAESAAQTINLIEHLRESAANAGKYIEFKVK